MLKDKNCSSNKSTYNFLCSKFLAHFLQSHPSPKIIFEIILSVLIVHFKSNVLEPFLISRI